MQIHIATSKGKGRTPLAAFDAALNNAGVANYNLLVLSSVIPPATEITIEPDAIPSEIMPGEWGDRLYVVMAEYRATKPGAEAWAGIGWVQDPETKKGLFVEHEGSDEQSVRKDIEMTLKGLMKTRGVDFGEIHMAVSGVTCADEPVCAMAVAVYQSSDWHNRPSFIGA